jgi:hypothetical protein
MVSAQSRYGGRMISLGAASNLTIEEHCGLAHLRRTLLDCAERDQAARAAHAEAVAARPDDRLGRGAPTRQRVIDVDEANDAFLWPLVAQYGWLGSDLVKVDGAHACWLLAQHTADPVHLIRLFGIRPSTAMKYVNAAHPDKALPGTR